MALLRQRRHLEGEYGALREKLKRSRVMLLRRATKLAGHTSRGYTLSRRWSCCLIFSFLFFDTKISLGVKRLEQKSAFWYLREAIRAMVKTVRRVKVSAAHSGKSVIAAGKIYVAWPKQQLGNLVSKARDVCSTGGSEARLLAIARLRCQHRADMVRYVGSSNAQGQI